MKRWVTGVRVTVIATGFGKEETKLAQGIAPAVVVEDLDLPSFVRKERQLQREVNGGEVERIGKLGGCDTVDEDAYDFPTFLRKQAD